MTVKDVFNHIQLLNVNYSEISSLGSFVSETSRMVQQSMYNEVINNIPEGSFAYKILTNSESYSVKQLWSIAYELIKNEEYVNEVSKEVNLSRALYAQKKRNQKAKLDANKQGSKEVRDYVKSNGGLLKDYDAFVKSSKEFKKEFYSKKFTMESANAFLNK